MDFHLFDRKEPALQQFRLISKETFRPFLNKEGKELLILCFLSLKNETIDKKSAAYHWQYFLKTGEVIDAAPDYIKEAKRKTDFLTLESEEKEMIMKIDKSKAIHDAVFATAIEEAEEKGIKEGIKKGIEQGREEEKRELAINLLETDLSITKISEVTGLDVKVVEQLKAEQG